MAATLDTLNPFRYRGYVYDEETGLYYLRSRYYNPVWGRFLNADNTLGNPGQLFDHNVFAYCKNNPVKYTDPDGNFAIAIPFFQSILPYILGILGIGSGLMLGDSLSNVISNSSVASSSSGDIVIARPAVVTRSKTKELSDIVASDEMTGAQYYIAYIGNDDYLHRSNYGMSFLEAKLYLGYEETIQSLAKQYRNKPWGVYTLYQSDAKLLATTFGNTEKPEVHGIGFYGHYHYKVH